MTNLYERGYTAQDIEIALGNLEPNVFGKPYTYEKILNYVKENGLANKVEIKKHPYSVWSIPESNVGKVLEGLEIRVDMASFDEALNEQFASTRRFLKKR